MATKIIFVAVAVMCTFGALDAKPHFDTQWLKLTPNDVIAQLDQILVEARNKVAGLQSFADEKMGDAIDEVNYQSNYISDNWNSKIDDEAKKKTDQGVDVTKCIAAKKQLSALADQINSQVKQCVDAEQKTIKDAFEALAAFEPTAKAIVEEAKKDVAQCDPSAGTIANIVCMIKALAKHGKDAGTVILGAGRQYIKIRSQIYNNIETDIFTCASQNSLDLVNQGKDIVDSIVKCIKDLKPSF